MEDDKKKYYFDFVMKVNSIAKTGLTFSKDPYALENYAELSKLSNEVLKDITQVDFSRPNYFKRDIYPTPSVSVRTVILSPDKKKVLLVREAYGKGGYSMPGGWCDLYISSMENAIKECKEEAGIKIKNISLLGVLNRIPFKSSVAIPEYTIIYKAEQDGDFFEHCHEVDDVGYFPIDNLPELSPKVSEEENKKIIDAAVNNKLIFE